MRMAALDAGDTALLAKLAIEAKYHQNCLRSLYNRARQEESNGNDGMEYFLHGIAFTELVAFLEVTVTVLEDMGNNFLKCSQDPLVVGTRDTKVAETVRRIETIGNE